MRPPEADPARFVRRLFIPIVLLTPGVALADEPATTPSPPAEPIPAPAATAEPVEPPVDSAPAAPAKAEPAPAPAEPLTVNVGFYVQPQFKARQNSVVTDDENGFTVRRTRIQVSAERGLACWKLAFRSEVEIFPSFTPQDAYVSVAGPLGTSPAVPTALQVNLGQFKAPFSRQTMLSDARLQLVEKAQIAGLSPERQVGASATLSLPMSELSLGIFNGEGKNVTDNADENFMYVGRLTFRPIGKPGTLAESAFGDPVAEVSGSVYTNQRDRGDFDEKVKAYSVDAFVAYAGASLAFEYTQIDTSYTDGAPAMPFTANGFYVQGGYLLPLPGWAYRRFELAARVEEIDRNDQVPIQQPGNPEQSLRYYTLGASYYHAKHDLKLQVQASHIEEIEDETGTGADAVFDNDTLLVQITYRQ